MEKEAGLVWLFTLVLACAGPTRPNELSLLPRDPLIDLGDPVQFNCSMNCPGAIFTWKGLDTKSGIVTSTPHYSILSLASTAVHNEGKIICEAACRGSKKQTKTSQLNLYSLPDAMQLTQQPAYLMCSIRRVYPRDSLFLSWYLGERKLSTPEQQDISDEDDERDEVQSHQLRLVLPEGVPAKGVTYRCEAELRLEGARFPRNKTIIFSMPAGQTAGTTTADHEEQSSTGMPITKDTPSTESVSRKEEAATETATTRLNLITEAETTRVNPTTETATTRLNLITEAETTRVNPTTEAETTRVNPTTETATTRLNLITEAETTRVNPTYKAETTRVNLTTDTATTRMISTSETAAIRMNPTSEHVKNKERSIPGMYGIKDNQSHQINHATGGDKNDITNPSFKPITTRELYTASVPDAIPEQTTTPTISPVANPTGRAPPKPGDDTASVAMWSVFSVLWLLSSGFVFHELRKRLSFLGPKKGSFELAQV